MALFNFLGGEFIDVIAWTDDTRDTMVWRFERRGNAIKYGAKLTVREGQAAVFVNEGQLADVFTPGLYQLETNNMPILTTLQHWDHGFQSPFKAEVYFVSTTRFNDQKWGTKNPIICRDPEFGPVRIRAFGTYAMRVSDPGTFLKEIVGTDGEFTADEISNQIRNVIVQEFSQVIAKSDIPVLDMAANTADLGKLVTTAINPTIAAYGLTLPEFYIENISLPDEVEKVLDKRTSVGIAGDLAKYSQFSAAEAMTASAVTPNSGMGAGLGMGMGMGMASQMAAGPWGAVPQAAQPATPAPAVAAPAVAAPPPPPPPPAPRLWHVAAGGQSSGPFDAATLRQMAGDGRLTRDTLVWSQGMAGWAKADAQADLAALFADVPPPLPPGA